MGAHLVRKVANPYLHQRSGIASRFDVFQVVASVPPTARGIDVRKLRRYATAAFSARYR